MKDVEPNNPDNWPRRIARNHADLGEAIAALLWLVDDANMDFALTEFIRQRITQEAGASAAVPRPQDWLRRGVVDDCTNCHTCDVACWWEPSGNVGPFCDTCADLLRRAVGQPQAVNAVDPVDRSGHGMTTRDITSLSSSSYISQPETETER